MQKRVLQRIIVKQKQKQETVDADNFIVDYDEFQEDKLERVKMQYLAT